MCRFDKFKRPTAENLFKLPEFQTLVKRQWLPHKHKDAKSNNDHGLKRIISWDDENVDLKMMAGGFEDIQDSDKYDQEIVDEMFKNITDINKDML